MRASVFHGAHDIRVEDVAEPVPAADEVLLAVRRSGMCGTDATEWRAGPRTFPVLKAHPASGHHGPMVLGHEFVGEVLEAPSGSGLRIGELVASGAGVWCGECDRCREGRTNLCRRYYTLGLSTHGGMAERVAVPERTLVPVPGGLGLDAAGLAQPMAVGLHAARRSGATAGQRVVVVGAGAIGTFVLAGLHHLGVEDVTVVDFAGSRLERAGRLGASRTVEVGDDLDERLQAAVGPDGIDVLIEASGAPGQLGRAVGLVHPGGTVLQVGIPAEPQSVDVHALVYREVSVQTTLAHVCDTDLAPALDILATTAVAAELLDSVRPLEELPLMLDRLVAGELEGKALFDPSLAA